MPRTDTYRYYVKGDGVRVRVDGKRSSTPGKKESAHINHRTFQKGTSPEIRVEYRPRKKKAVFDVNVRPLGALRGQLLHTPLGVPGVKAEYFAGTTLNSLLGKWTCQEAIDGRNNA